MVVFLTSDFSLCSFSSTKATKQGDTDAKCKKERNFITCLSYLGTYLTVNSLIFLRQHSLTVIHPSCLISPTELASSGKFEPAMRDPEANSIEGLSMPC